MNATYLESADKIRSGDWHQCDTCNAVYSVTAAAATVYVQFNPLAYGGRCGECVRLGRFDWKRK